MNRPEISVVIPTYNRCSSLLDALASLELQRFGSDRFEVIVVDDGSTDNTADELEEWQRTTSLRAQVIRKSNGGPAAARNAGLSRARGEIIAFTDDDCMAEPGWLDAVYLSLTQNSWQGVQGSTYTDKSQITPLTHQIDNENGNPSVPTCNAAYRRSSLMAVGGFDEGFPYPHNEDADLAWRVQKVTGGEIGFSREMRVYHPVRVDKFKKVARRMKIMESEFRLYFRNPESYRQLRSTSPWMTIYWVVGVKTQLYYLVSRLKRFDRPAFMLQGLLLAGCWSWDLIRLWPRFVKVSCDERTKV